MKKLTALLATILLALTPISPAQAADRFDLGNQKLAGGEVMMQIIESDVLEGSSSIMSHPKDQTRLTQEERRNSFKRCSTLADPNCDLSNSANQHGASIVFPNCGAGTSPYCVEDLSIAVNGSEYVKAEFKKMADNGLSVKGSPAQGLLDGGAPSLFEYKNPVTGEVYNFAVTVRVLQQYNASTKKFDTPFLTASVLPYITRADSNVVISGSGAANGCVYAEVGQCGVPQEFEEGFRAQLTFSAPSFIGGWFRGRMRDPQIAVTKVDAKTNRITIGAEPVSIPKLGVVRVVDKLTPQEKAWYDRYAKFGTKGGLGSGIDASNREAFDFVEYFRPNVNDTVSGTGKSWFLTTIDSGRGSGCLADTSKVQGIVTTNALVYDGSAPAFQNGFLNYKVGGLHHMPDGKTPIQGSYDLVIRSETARCLYRFSNAPLSATISVTGGAERNVATTVVSEKNGWLKLAAYGFTFSDKTIKVKITKKAVKPKAKPAPKKR
jgi:hypothetical protein